MLGVLNELKQRRIKEAINAAFPNTIKQICIVHMIRNSVKFVSYKNLKPFTNIFDEEKGYEQLQEVKTKWSDKYESAFKT